MKPYRAIMDEAVRIRKERIGSGPSWLLTGLKVREPHRRRGAGVALTRWGVEQAAGDDTRAYLKAAPAGVSLYERIGFQRKELVTMSIMGIEISVMIMRVLRLSVWQSREKTAYDIEYAS